MLNSGFTKPLVRASRNAGWRNCTLSRSSGKTFVSPEASDPERVEDDPGLEIDAQVAETAEEVVVLPADEEVQSRS